MTHTTNMKTPPKHKLKVCLCPNGVLIEHDTPNTSSFRAFFQTIYKKTLHRHLFFLFLAIALGPLYSTSAPYAQDFTNHIQSSSRVTIVHPGTSFEMSIPLNGLEIQNKRVTIQGERDFLSKFENTNLLFAGDSFQLLCNYNNVNTFDELVKMHTVQFPHIRLNEETELAVSWQPGMKFHVDQYPTEKESVLVGQSRLLEQAYSYPKDYNLSNEIASLARTESRLKSALSRGAIAFSYEELDSLRAEYDFLNTIVAQLHEQSGNVDHLSRIDRLRFEALVDVSFVREEALSAVGDRQGIQFDATKREVVVSVVFPDGSPSHRLKIERYIPFKDKRGNPYPVQLVGTSTPARARLNIAYACYYGKDNEGQVVTDVVAHRPRTTRTYNVPLRNVGAEYVESNRDEVCVR